MLGTRCFVSDVSFLVFKRPDQNKMYTKIHTLFHYYLPLPHLNLI
jgi:hypothetical protein